MLIPTFSRLPGCAKRMTPAHKKRVRSLLTLIAAVAERERTLRITTLRLQIRGLPADVVNKVWEIVGRETHEINDYLEQRFFTELDAGRVGGAADD